MPEGYTPKLRPVTFVPDKQGLSYVDNHEIDEAKREVDKLFIGLTGKPFGLRVANYYVAVKLYVRPEEIKEVTRDDGTKATLWLPTQVVEGDKYHSVAALVCGIGPGAFKGYDDQGRERFPEGPSCRVGDWVCIPRTNCFVINYRGVPAGILPDDMILSVIEDPTDVTPINQKPLV